VYTNARSIPMYISVAANGNLTNSMSLRINGITVCKGISDSLNRSTLVFGIVPSGSTYLVYMTPLQNPTALNWYEIA
jgi:hypothetical protein